MHRKGTCLCDSNQKVLCKLCRTFLCPSGRTFPQPFTALTCCNENPTLRTVPVKTQLIYFPWVITECQVLYVYNLHVKRVLVSKDLYAFLSKLWCYHWFIYPYPLQSSFLKKGRIVKDKVTHVCHIYHGSPLLCPQQTFQVNNRTYGLRILHNPVFPEATTILWCLTGKMKPIGHQIYRERKNAQQASTIASLSILSEVLDIAQLFQDLLSSFVKQENCSDFVMCPHGCTELLNPFPVSINQKRDSYRRLRGWKWSNSHSVDCMHCHSSADSTC